MGICFIVGAGNFTARELCPQPGDLLIAADGGYAPLRQLGLTPQLLLGDFDSLPGGLPESLPEETQVIRVPVEKDDTDTGLALARGWQLGYRTFRLYGCGGGRVDHLLANLQTMGCYAQKGADIQLVDIHCAMFALHNGSLILPPRPIDSLVSVFCHGAKATGVTLEGLQYPLHNATLTCDYPLGVSNHYRSERPKITVQDGTLIVLVEYAD